MEASKQKMPSMPVDVKEIKDTYSNGGYNVNPTKDVRDTNNKPAPNESQTTM